VAVDALYLARDETTLWAEWYRHLAERGVPPLKQLPRDVWRLCVPPLRIADVSDEQRLGRAGLAFPMPGRRTWPLYQGLGETLWREGWNGLLAPSAAHPAGRILCLFIDDPLASQRSRFRRLPSCRSHRCRPPECVREGPGE